MADDLTEAALEYHRNPVPGKIQVMPTKPLATARDLGLAYTPGVAVACNAIVDNPEEAYNLTARGNLVGVVTNGTAVLGLGAIGPLASKPVMEGKGVLFKKFAGIDVFDIEIDELDVDKLVDIIASLEPTFGGINLEDIKAPECFEVERRLRERMKIPVFHDDQHGTAIIVAAAVFNGLRVVGKKFEDVKLVTSGAGAAALACVDLLVHMGVRRENVTLTDIVGVVYEGRNELMDKYKERYCQKTECRTLAEVIEGADVFLGLSAPNVLKPEMVASMAARPIIMALANPTPEIMPDEVKAVRDDAIMATGRSDFPNQVNNVLCFPFIFRGALDVGATVINEEMKIACVKAIADLAMAEPSDVVAAAYSDQELVFGPDYLIPKPFDPRLIVEIAPAVAKAAMDSGVARRPIEDFEAYRQKLTQFVFRSGLVMKHVFDRAREAPKRVVFSEGEDERVLRAAQQMIEDKLGFPILIARPEVVETRIKRMGLKLVPGENVEIVNPQSDPRFPEYWKLYHQIMERHGVSPDYARTVVRTRTTAIATLMIKRGEADAMICGTIGRYNDHLRHITDIIGKAEGVRQMSALNLLVLSKGTYFLADTYVTPDPSAEEIADLVVLAADEVRRFGIEPKVALLSHSSFGSHDTPSAVKMREALQILMRRAPDLQVEGEMHGDAAVSEAIRSRIFPSSRLTGPANLFIMPTLDAANISFNLLKVLGEGLSVGPILLGAAMPVHILTPSVTVRGIVNMAALAVVDAQSQETGA
ncbi:MAG: NADP-dependent malic enzyme [Alphaproteobacteria bacterium]|nr:NADP-dependent malic enzyme [Alphaproteobacteria bacterium]MBU0799316.1 NADP-dependent malic enzyme [Alphaproteobacteria bacterium]MBU0888170.1 NADP-dependent malic enzyme [Alphaproteobacteria bacterium]MBU1811615.1 NADP-dependent malic enzyme [Alphaproteobacteria bacterium]